MRVAAAAALLLASAGCCWAWTLGTVNPCGIYGKHQRPEAYEPYCTWSGFVSIPYQPKSDLALVEALLPKSCNDALLTPQLRQNCQRCCGLRTRDACLGGVAQKWNNGADVQSCNWMSFTEKKEKVREVEYSLGVNNPYMLASIMNVKACSQTRVYTVLSDPKAYSTAYFTLLAAVDDPDDVIARPLGLAPDVSCLVRSPATTCTIIFQNSDDVHFTLSSRDMWTTNLTIMNQLRAPGNEDCQYNPKAKCVPANPPFRYQAKIIEHLCPEGVKPSEKVVCAGYLPMSEPGALLMPGGKPLNYRETGFFLQGAKVVRWKIRADKAPVMVFVAPTDVALSACPLGTEECDYRKLWPIAVQSSMCYWTECDGSYDRRAFPDRDEVLMVTYLKYPNKEQYYPQGTTRQTVYAEVTAWPPFHIDANK